MNDPLYPWLQNTYDALQSRIASNALHHGLLFIADNGVGEHRLLHTLAKALLCSSKNACGKCKSCLLFDAKSHPDMKEVLSDKPSIGVDLIRTVSTFVTSTSQLLGNKVVLIENIDSMTESASNSLLKTLEEPNNNTYLLLSTTNPNAILATITSRCEKYRVTLPSKQEALAWLAQQSELSVNEESLQAYGGSPLEYLAAMSSKEANYQDFCDDMLALQQKQISPQSFAKKWEKQASQCLTWTYQHLINHFAADSGYDNSDTGSHAHGNSASNQQVSNRSGRLADATEYLAIADECVTANRKIAQAGINKMLLLQRIFNQISRL